MNKVKNITLTVLAVFFIGAGIAILKLDSLSSLFPKGDKTFYGGVVITWGALALIMTGKKKKPDFTVTVKRAE